MRFKNMNNKFKGDLDFYELEDISHRLEVIELILREDEIPFSMKWAYGAGNSDMWLFEGTAKRNGDNYIAENIIGKKFKGSTGDDDGNDIIFTKVIYDHEFFELRN
jgi:predicted CoA-binding protein